MDDDKKPQDENPPADDKETQDPPDDDTKPDENDEKADDSQDEDDTPTTTPDDIEPEVREPEATEPDSKDDDDVDPEDAKAIDTVVKKRIAPLEANLKQQQTQLEVDTFLAGNPELKNHRTTILKYANHKAYANIPINNIAAIVASKDLERAGARKEREAQKKAADSKSPGSSTRKTKTTVDWSTVPKEQFEAKIAEIKGLV